MWWLAGAALAADSGERFERWGERPRDPALEVNVLWPFFPGGISDVKVLAPAVRADQDVLRGEVVAGLHSDFSWGPLTRPVDRYGKVSSLGVKLGWRQFAAYGWHVELSADTGWRHEEGNVYDGATLDSLTCRAWVLGGWQADFSRRVYTNVRGGVGVNVFRVGDPYADTERPLAPGGDVNLGIRF